MKSMQAKVVQPSTTNPRRRRRTATPRLRFFLAFSIFAIGVAPSAFAKFDTLSTPLSQALEAQPSQEAHANFAIRGSRGYRILVDGGPKGVRLVTARQHEAAIY